MMKGGLDVNQAKIGSFLKELRRERGITQEQLAEALHVSSRTVSRWETGSNMPDISILVDLADYYDVSIPELINGERKSETMNEEEREIARTMSDYATTEKENIFKEMRLQSIMGLCALVLCAVLHETGAYLHSDLLGKLTNYCEALVFVSVLMMAAFTTGALSKLRGRSRVFHLLQRLKKPLRILVMAVVAFCGAALIKLTLVHFFG